MKGEKSETMTESYIHRNLERLLNKIDKQQIGMTWTELVKKVKTEKSKGIFGNILKRHPYDGLYITATINKQLEAEGLRKPGHAVVTTNF